MLNFQRRQPNKTAMARTLNLALLLGHPLCISFHICTVDWHVLAAL